MPVKEILLHCLSASIGLIIAIAIDWWVGKKYGYPTFSVLMAKIQNSKRFSWLAWNVWGDDSAFYNKVFESLKNK